MSKHSWHISRKDEKPEVVRHYQHISKMFQFILRNPAMFKDRILTIYNRNIPVIDITFREVQEMIYSNYKEGKIRSELIKKVHHGENIYKYRGPIR